MAQLINVRLSRHDAQPWGLRLQGGKDFGTPLLVQKVNLGSIADQVGVIAGDAVIKVNGVDVYNLRHKDAQDLIVRSGNSFDLTLQRGGSTWKPHVSPTGSLPSPGQHYGGGLVTKTSLHHHPPPNEQHIGCGYNNAARPYTQNGGGGPVKSIVNKQYNTPVGMYSEEAIAETLTAQAEVLANGVLGVNFKKNEKAYNSAGSEVLKVLKESENDPAEPDPAHRAVTPVTKHVNAPVDRPAPPSSGGLPPGQNICSECERLIVGVFVRIKDKNLHVDCFKCATCGTSLKNQGYFNINNKLYCDVHAKSVAVQHPPHGTEGYRPALIQPNSKLGANTISAALSAHQNGNVKSNVGGPKPFGGQSVPLAGPRSPASYPSATQNWSQPSQPHAYAAPQPSYGSNTLPRSNAPGRYSTQYPGYNFNKQVKVSAPTPVHGTQHDHHHQHQHQQHTYQNGHSGLVYRNKNTKPELTTHARDRRSYIEKDHYNQNKYFNHNNNHVKSHTTEIASDLRDGKHPICSVCHVKITRGPFITALGRIWCPDHFVCVNGSCRRPLQDIGFVEEKGDLYCEFCFEQFLAPPCDKCGGKIKGDCLNAIGKHFHPECFNCSYCGKLFGNKPFFLEDGHPYCEADWNELFTTKCFACGFPVEAGDRWVEALSHNYHSQCFNCTTCKRNLEGQSFYAKAGRPYCKNHAR